jgi:hypothetical protein
MWWVMIGLASWLVGLGGMGGLGGLVAGAPVYVSLSGNDTWSGLYPQDHEVLV